MISTVKDLGISTQRYYDWKANPAKYDGRTHPNRAGIITNQQEELKLPQEVKDTVVGVLTNPEYAELSVAQIWGIVKKTLGDAAPSRSSVYRLARQLGFIPKQPAPKAAPLPANTFRRKPAVAKKPWDVLSWDVTLKRYLDSNGTVHIAYIFACLDVYSRMLLGMHAYTDQAGTTAVMFFQSLFDKYRGQIDERQHILLHSDNGSAMRSTEFVAFIGGERLHIDLSYSRPRTSNDNPFIESLFGSLKGPYKMNFDGAYTIAECNARLAELTFEYNERRFHSRISYVTPGSRFRGEDAAIIEKQNQEHLRYYQAHPKRFFSGKVHLEKVTGVVYHNCFTPEQHQIAEADWAAANAWYTPKEGIWYAADDAVAAMSRATTDTSSTAADMSDGKTDEKSVSKVLISNKDSTTTS